MSRLVVYVAGASAEVQRCERFMRAVRGIGCEVAHDWTAEVLGEDRPDHAIPDVEARQYVSTDLLGVARSDVLVVLVPYDYTTVGAWVELGYALGLEVPVMLVGEHMDLPFFVRGLLGRTAWVRDEDEALASLGRWLDERRARR